MDQCAGQLAQCDAMLAREEGCGALSHLGMIWMLFRDVKDSLSRCKELLRAGQLRLGLVTQFDIRPLLCLCVMSQ